MAVGGAAESLAVIGTGGFAHQILPQLRNLTRQSGPDRVRFAQSAPLPADFGGFDVAALDDLSPQESFVVAVADPAVRHHIAEQLARRGLSAASLIAPTALIADDADVGAGAIVCDYAIIESGARVGRHFHANVYSFVAHQCVIGDYVTVGPRVCCNGNVTIGDGAYLGAGAIIRQGTPEKPLVIGSGAIVGMGAVVTKDVAAGAVVAGNPARLLRSEAEPIDAPGTV